MSLPTCPSCHRTDYALEYDREGNRTGRRRCNLCGHRWPAQPEGAKG